MRRVVTSRNDAMSTTLLLDEETSTEARQGFPLWEALAAVTVTFADGQIEVEVTRIDEARTGPVVLTVR